MMDPQTPTNDKDLLNSKIDALLNKEGIPKENQDLSPELNALLSTVEKVITHAEIYPGVSNPTAQQRLAIMSAYRSEMKQREVVEKKPKSWLSLFQNTTVRWVAAVGIALLVTLGIFLSTPSSGSTVLSGAAGQLSAIYPVVLLALIILGIILYIIFRRKK